MENVLYFILFCVLQKCWAKQESSTLQDILNQRSFISISNSSVIYNETRCSPGQRMISFNDVVNLQKQSLNISGFTAAVWINATGSYTPWVIYQGLYTMKAEHILNSTGVNETTQFIDCVRFCSLVNWTYIGLQKDKCYCLSSDALQKENQRLNVSINRNFTTCGTADILYCATTNRKLKMAVYKKDESHYKGIGECLKVIVENEMYLSYVPSPCKKQEKSSILCIESKNTFQTIQDINTNQRLQACEVYKKTFVDFKTLNTTMNVRPHTGCYYLNNLRESIFSQEGQTLQAHCVTGKAVGGKIELHITDCATSNYAMCIDDEAMNESKTHNATTSNTYLPSVTTVSVSGATATNRTCTTDATTEYSDFKVTPTAEIKNIDATTEYSDFKVTPTAEIKNIDATTEYSDFKVTPTAEIKNIDATTEYSDFKVTPTAEIKNIDGSAILIIIVSVVSVVILLVIIPIVIVIRFWCCKQRKPNCVQGPVYASVRNETILDTNVIKKGNGPEVVHALVKEDSTYDHTDFTTRNPLRQTDASNYDTMENIQLTGESIYHHTVTFTTRPELHQTDASNYDTTENIQQAGESIYHHTVNFKTSAHQMQGDESVYHYTSNFKLPTASVEN